MSTIRVDLLTNHPSSHHKQQHSRFEHLTLSLNELNGMAISDRQDALNFRHRTSQVGYQSDWHVAGDPTLIIVRQGQLTLELFDGTCRTYYPGEQFIAADYPHPTQACSGHRARVEGDSALVAVHIKLSADPLAWHHKVLA